MPKELLFREILTRNYRDGRLQATITRGLAGYNKGKWWMAINLGLGHPLLIKECLAHEAAHIADAIKTGGWGHGKSWQETHEQLKQIIFEG